MNKIEWQSWNSIEEELSHKQKSVSNILSDDDEIEDKQETIVFPPLNQPYIITPFGTYDPESPFRPAQRWECWIGHTNFRLTKAIVAMLVNVDGISALKVLDRYSFCIGVGKMFKFKHVASEINRILCSVPEKDLIEDLPENIKDQINKLKKEISSNKYWCIFVDLDNNIHHHKTDSIEDFKSNLNSLERIKKNFGGYLLKNED